MQRNLFLLLLFAVIVLAVVLSQYLPTSQQPATDPTPTRVLRPSKAGEFRGFSLQLHHAGDDHPYETLLDQIAESGANTVCLVVHGYQEHAGSQAIFIDSRKTPDNERLKKLIAHAHDRELRVMLMPVVLLAKRRGSEWRGKINPDNWDEWWKDYTGFIQHYAWVAGEMQVEIFSVGSELVSTERMTDRWRELIARVRKATSARLTYSANWDHYQVPEFWGDLDIVGMTTYYTLSKADRPTLENLKTRWAEIRREIFDWQKTVGRPILFTEVGWPNQVTAAEFPWNYYASPEKPAPALQADCFKSFFHTFIGQPQVAGFIVWEWPNHPDQDTDPNKDTSYCPVGKPAMTVIQEFFQQAEQTQPQEQ